MNHWLCCRPRRFRFARVLLVVQAGVLTVATGCDILPGPPPEAVTYYVDATTGDDAADGLTAGSAWKTLDAVNARTIAGATVLFHRGEVFRGQLRPVSGTAVRPTTYSAYGVGALPEIRGSVNVGTSSAWTEASANVWQYASPFNTDVGNLIFDDATEFGMKKFSAGELSTQGDYYYDLADGSLNLYSASNPGTHYGSIEAALRLHVVDQQGKSWVTYENLSVRFGAAHGFGGGSTAHITIRDCEISYIGGGDLDMDGSNIRFGNGIEFWGNAHDHLVERNYIWEIYDTALSNQNHTQTVAQRTITYRNNVIWNTGMSTFEYWSRPEGSHTSDIIFEHNTAAGAGAGWGAPPQRPDTVGVHVLLAYSPAAASNIVIRNNVFSGGNLVIYMAHGYQWQNVLELDHNCYYKASGNLIEVNDTGDPDNPAHLFTVTELGGWQSLSAQDAHSMVSDPQFVNEAGHDFSLEASSPCVDAGIAGLVTADIDGAGRPVGAGVDIGAYER